MAFELFSPAPPDVDVEQEGSLFGPPTIRGRGFATALSRLAIRRRGAVFAGALLLVMVVVAACSPTYVVRAAVEEARILWRRQPIAEVLRDPTLDPDRRAKLAMVLRARTYAAERFGLRVAGSFATLSEVDGRAVVQLLTAARRERLKSYTWWFPVVGSMPYKGFFSVVEAHATKQALERDGYDTYLRPAVAFSTLGWFDDPLPSTLLARSQTTLAEVVFHELFHNTLFLPSRATFNESAATFVGHRGAVEFFCGASSTEAECRESMDVWRDTLEMSRFISSATAELEAFYETKPDPQALERGRTRLFGEIRARFRKLELRTTYYSGFATAPLNNASLLQERIYLRDLDLFEELYRQAGDLAHTIVALRTVTRKPGDPFEQVGRFVGSKRFEVVKVHATAS